MVDKFNIQWIDRRRLPSVAADPAFPDGRHIDSGQRPACRVELPYMTQRNVGLWYIECGVCGGTALITMASRPDDPRSVMMPCVAKNESGGHT